jgi:hypothetical protein
MVIYTAFEKQIFSKKPKIRIFAKKLKNQNKIKYNE